MDGLFKLSKDQLRGDSLLQLSLTSIRSGYSGGPIVTQDRQPKLIGIAFAASPANFSGLGASAD